MKAVDSSTHVPSFNTAVLVRGEDAAVRRAVRWVLGDPRAAGQETYPSFLWSHLTT